MSYRFSRRVGAVVLLILAVGTACGSRDSLFVNDDLEGSAGGDAGSLSFGGRGGSPNAGGRAGVGVAGFGQGAGSGFAGATGFAGFAGQFAFGGSAGFGGVSFGGFSGNAFAGAAGFAATGGAGFSCAACLAQNAARPCTIAKCDLVHNVCELIPQSDGVSCPPGDLCIGASVCQGGECIGPAVACPPTAVQCRQSTCDPSSGRCVDQAVTGTSCSSGDPCAPGECVAGICEAGTAVTTCQSGDQCCPAGCTSGNDHDCAPTPPRQMTLTAIDRGWFDDTGFHDPTIKNTFTGFSLGATYNSFFVFDLVGVSGTILSAQLLLEEENFFGPSAKQTASIWDVSESGAVLALSSPSLRPQIFQDLQSGNQYGSFVGSAQAIGTTFTITLNPKAVTDLNAARGGSFSVGIHIDTLSGQTFDDEGIRFSEGAEPRTDQLVLTVQ